VIRYEHPLNERIRTLMRLEDLYRRAQFFAAQVDPADHHAALSALFEITDVAARADLKTDLLQELERQKQLLQPLRNNPAIETRVLEQLLADIDRASAALLAQTGKAGLHLRDNEWLMTISSARRSRAASASSTCPRTITGSTPTRVRGRTTCAAGSHRSCRSTTASTSSCAYSATTAGQAGRRRWAVCSSSC
jgi:cell division FtsZ-interacting protein ZapD